MTTLLRLEEAVLNRWARRSDDRRVRAAAHRVYASFARRYPTWAATLHDEEFLMRGVDTVLGDYPNVAPAHLAAAWADQMWHRDSAMRRRIVDLLQPAATAFLSLVEREVAQAR